MMFKKQRHLLTQREEAGAFRFLKQSEGLIDFCSNDYLGLAKEGSVFKGKHVIGSGGSRLLSGNYPEVERLECFLAEFHQSESALVFNSGDRKSVV